MAKIIIVGEHHAASTLAGKKELPKHLQHLRPLVEAHRKGWAEITNALRGERVAVALEGNLPREEAERQVKLRLGDLPVQEIHPEIDHPGAARVAREIKERVNAIAGNPDELWKELKQIILGIKEMEPIAGEIKGIETWEEFQDWLERMHRDHVQPLIQMDVPPEFWDKRARAARLLAQSLPGIALTVLNAMAKRLESLSAAREEHMANKIAEIAGKTGADVLLVIVGAQHADKIAKELGKLGHKVEVRNLVKR